MHPQLHFLCIKYDTKDQIHIINTFKWIKKCLSCSLLNAYHNRYATMVLSKFNKLLYEQFSCTKNVFVVSQFSRRFYSLWVDSFFSIIFSLTLINYVIQVRVTWLILYHQAQLETRLIALQQCN